MPKTHPDRSTLAASIGVIAAVLWYYRILWPTFQDFNTALDWCDIPFCDFVVYYYEMGRTILVTKAPVTGYYYSPLSAIVFSAFGMLPLNVATAAWALLLIVATALFLILTFKIIYESRPTLTPFSIALVLLSFPHLHNFKWGQVSTLVTILLLGSLYSFLKKREVAAGILLALAVSLKYYPVVFLIPFLMTRNTRLLLSALIAFAMFLVVIPAVVLGWQETLVFTGELFRGAYANQLSAGGPNSQSFVNVAMRWMHTAGFENQTLRFALRAFGYLMAEVTVAIVFLIHRSSMPRAPIWAFVFLFLSIPFFVATSWPHYLVYLPFCQLFLFEQMTGHRGSRSQDQYLPVTLLFLSILLGSVFAFNVFSDWEGYTGTGLLFLSNALLIGLSIHLVLPPLSKFLNSTPPFNRRSLKRQPARSHEIA